MNCENKYVLFFDSDKWSPEITEEANFECNVSKIPANNQIAKFLWTHLRLPRAIKAAKIDLFHETSFIAPFIKNCPIVTTVYDTAFVHIPSCYNYRTKMYLRSSFAGSLRRSDAVIAISEATKKDIIDTFSVSPDKIGVVHAGVDEIYRIYDDKEKKEEVKKIYGIEKDFILCVSAISPRKNFVRLVKAFSLLRREKRIDAQLVFAGQQAWQAEEVSRQVRSSGLDSDVVFCGYVPKEHLLCLYNTARVFAFPSLYEGFGLPILEAFACGCPVIASNVSSMPEVCGDAALLVDPRDIEDLAYAIYKLVSDEPFREDLIKKGLERVKKFSWEKASKETVALYERTAKQKKCL